jgi:hypothetical protein
MVDMHRASAAAGRDAAGRADSVDSIMLPQDEVEEPKAGWWL